MEKEENWHIWMEYGSQNTKYSEVSRKVSEPLTKTLSISCGMLVLGLDILGESSFDIKLLYVIYMLIKFNRSTNSVGLQVLYL